MLDNLVKQLDYIVRTNQATLNDRGIEAGKSIVGRRMIAFSHARIEDRLLDSFAVWIKLVAGLSRLGDFDNSLARAEALSFANLLEVNTLGSEIFAKRARKERPTIITQ